jgi:alkylation response protein AidB-like acyl-CoA dehydrogenase
VRRTVLDEDHELFRASVRAFVEQQIVPRYEEWERLGVVDRAVWKLAGEAGFLGIGVPEEYGGSGEADFGYNAVVVEEIARVSALGVAFQLQNDVVLPYLLGFATEEQKQRWLPGLVSGEIITAIALTEPGTGSDLASIRTAAVRDGAHYVLNGSKTFISNGQLADLVLVAARTGGEGRRGLSLLAVERGMVGFTRGRNLDKIGMHAQDTSELFFADVRVPVENLLGEENQGFYVMMSNLAQERLSMAIAAVACSQAIIDKTIEYVQSRTAFGKRIAEFQNTRFVLAELSTEVQIARVFVDRCLADTLDGSLAAEDAAMAKWWTTELQSRVADRCLQLHGGWGYMNEYFVARAWRDTRSQTIGGGSTEIMKEIVARSLGLTE